jgi:hypothetical protein
LVGYVKRELEGEVTEDEYLHLYRLAAIGDHTMDSFRMKGGTRVELLRDDTIEMVCSAIGTAQLGVKSGNILGAKAIDVIGASAQYLLGYSDRKRAAEITRETAKLEKNMKEMGQSGSWGRYGQTQGQGKGKGQSWGPYYGGGGKKGKGGGKKGKGGIECDYCHALGHTLRWCPDLQSLLDKEKAANPRKKAGGAAEA